MIQRKANTTALAALLAGAALLFLFRLDATDLWAPDEPRFAQVAEELRSMDHGASGLVVLHLNGEIYTQKPPLSYWISAAIGSVSGRVTEWAARAPSALAGIAVVLLTVHFGAHLGSGRLAIWLAGAMLLSTYRFAQLARRAQFDVILTLFTTLALLACWRLRETSSSERTRWLIVLHGSLGLAVLTKGPVGLLPIAIVAIFLFWQGEFEKFRGLFPLRWLLLSLGAPLLWVFAALALTPDGYFGEAIVDNVFGRFFTGTAHIRPFYYFIYQFPIDFLPWSLLWPLAARQFWRSSRSRVATSGSDGRAGERLLLSWVGVFFVFFSISAGKRGLYLVPAYPAAAMLCARAFEQEWASKQTFPRLLGVVLVACAIFAAGLGVWIGVSQGLELERHPGFALSAGFGVTLAGLAIIALLAAAACILQQRSIELRLTLIITSLAVVELGVFGFVYPAFDIEKSPRLIAEAADRIAPAGQPIALFDHPEFVGGAAYYADRRIVPVANAREVRSFFETLGSTLIVKEQKLERAGDLENFCIHARARSGARSLLVVSPRGASPSPREFPAQPANESCALLHTPR